MTKEERKLLVQDLFARIPYRVIVEHTSGFRSTLNRTNIYPTYKDSEDIDDYICEIDFFGDNDYFNIEEFKPFLFPLSSMTEEQQKELKNYTCPDGSGVFNKNGLIVPSNHYGDEISFEFMENIFHWLNTYHFDYRGLIEKGLAFDATGKNIY